MTTRALWSACAAAGIVAFACSTGFGRIGLVPCGPTGGLSPIIALELVRSPAEVAALFGAEPCTSAFVAAQRTGLLLDGLGFIPFYTAFLILAIAALAGGGWLKWGGIAVIAAAGLGDEIEGYFLGRILDTLPGTQALVDALSWVVHVKFALLALGTLWIAVLLLAHWRVAGMILSLIVGIGAMTAGAGLLSGPSPVMMTGFAVAWISLLVVAIIGTIRPMLLTA